MSGQSGEAVTVAVRQHGEGADSRALYVRTANPESSFSGGRSVELLRAEVRGLAAETTTTGELDVLSKAASTWAAEETSRFRELLDRTRGDDGRDALVRRVALACAPLALRSGAWLQWLSAPGNADDPVVLSILTLYASDAGVGHPQASRGSLYLALLRHLQLSEHAVPVSRLTHDPRIADRDFYLPAVLTAMSRRPDDFRLEILGADLCLRATGLLPACAIIEQAHPTAADWVAIDPASSRGDGKRTDLEQCVIAVEAAIEAAGDSGLDVVRAGFGWAFTAIQRWSDNLYAELDESRAPSYEMAELLRLRAREGSVYHQEFKLGGRPLSEWLQDSRTDPSELLAVLAGSKLVKPGRSEASALVNGLVGERGPMFRVFAPADLKVIRRWIDSLPDVDEDEPVARQPAVAPNRIPQGLLASLDAPEADREPSSTREAYHLLQRRTATPAVRDFARDYVRGWLARSRHGMETDEQRLPDTWSPVGLRPWLVEQHDRHGADFEAKADTPIPSRDDLIDSTLQLAPLTLIDGAWLQGFTDYEHVSSEQGYFLFETYWDELGNGEARLNHLLIYREVLAEMDVHLPPTASREFAEWPALRDGSFELPVYWLSIGRFPRTFMPEILGLNLAMELSGVGGTYRRARMALKKYGFSTRFVDIHNTIDNVATGHSAWAADAVDTYLASVLATQGADVQAETWERVRTGFRSLNPPSGFRAKQAFRKARKASKAR